MITDALFGSASSTAATQSATAASPGGTMGKDEFLKLLVAQLRNQDPMNPSRPEEFAAQLAQFSSVEQLINMNASLASQAEASQAMAQALNNSSAASILGKDVLALGDGVRVTGTGDESVTVGVDGSGGVATLTLFDADGNKVGSREVGAIGGGRQEIELGEAAEGLAPGAYTYELTVTGATGESVQVRTYQRAVVDGLRYGPQGTILLAGGLEIPLADVVEMSSQTD
jgi:flagellar basal-body rod modification protein FlgD